MCIEWIFLNYVLNNFIIGWKNLKFSLIINWIFIFYNYYVNEINWQTIFKKFYLYCFIILILPTWFWNHGTLWKCPLGTMLIDSLPYLIFSLEKIVWELTCLHLGVKKKMNLIRQSDTSWSGKKNHVKLGIFWVPVKSSWTRNLIR